MDHRLFSVQNKRLYHVRYVLFHDFFLLGQNTFDVRTVQVADFI